MAHNWRSSGWSIVIALAYAGCGGGQAKQEGGAAQTTAGAENAENKAMISEESLRSTSTDVVNDQRAEAKLAPAPDVEIKGGAKFEPVPDGVLVSVSVENATPGEHGIHVHQRGDCSDIPNKSMGEHLQPEGNPHGLPSEPAHHLGDMGNIEIGANGKGKLDFVIKDATLDNGRNTLLGKALVIHDKEDIGVGKSGESGAPIACGVIESKH